MVLDPPLAMNVHPVVAGEAPGEQTSKKMLGKRLLEGARASLVTGCLSASTMAALCPHVLGMCPCPARMGAGSTGPAEPERP